MGCADVAICGPSQNPTLVVDLAAGVEGIAPAKGALQPALSQP